MAQTILNLQIAFNGKTPIVAGDKRLTALNIGQLLYALNHGSRIRDPINAPATPYVQYQTGVVQASGTVTPAAVQSGDTVSVGGQALTATKKRATGTATAASVQAGDTITVAGLLMTAVSGAVVPGEATFDCSGSDTACATSIAAQFNAYASPLTSGRVGAKSAAAVATFYAIEKGTGGNSFTLASSNGGRLAVSGALFTGGAAPSNNAFDFSGTNAMTADDIAAAINDSSTAAVKQVTAASSGGVVTATAKVGGTGGNAIAWVSSNGSRLAVSGSGTLAGGAADAPVKMTF